MIGQAWGTLLHTNASIIKATLVLVKHYRAKTDVKTIDGWGWGGVEVGWLIWMQLLRKEEN